MSSMFEGPSQPSRIFSAPPQRRLFWPKVLGAFAAGVVVTVLITKIPSDPNPVPAPVTSSKLSRVEAAKQREQAAKVEQERKAATRGEASGSDTRPGELAGAPAPAAQGGTASPAPQPDSTTAARAPAAPAADPNQIAKQADELNCAQQTWPYVDEKCREANGNANQSTRPVRVIPTDRSAPSSVTTAAPAEATVPMPPAKPRVADTPTSTPPAPRVATEAPRATTGAAPAAEAPREPARREQAEAPVRPAPATVAAPPSRETTGHASTEAVQDTPPVTKSANERRQRRDASRRERGKEAGETRRSREATRTRNRSAEDEDDVDMVVREHRLSDGRRVIIQRRPADDVADEGSARRVIIQRRTVNRDDEPEERAPAPGLRLPPFFINPFGDR